MIGSTLGHYRIEARIGKGGMGEVYRARDTKLDRDVALKILPSDKSGDLERIQRFEREAKAVAALNHPNIVTIHSVEHVDGVRFLTMELVEGKTLAEIIPKDGLALEKLFEIAIPAADALSAAHAKGVAHRDLKPSNIMVDAAGRVKVLDFGLAKLLVQPADPQDATVVADEVTAEGKILGTTSYMSPEQAESKPLDHRSDIFSLGVVLYEMATGDRPFHGDTPLSTISAILKDTPPPVTERRAALPRHLGRVIGRCLEKNPDRRFQTARDVCNELEGLQKEVQSGDVELSSSGSLSRDDLIAAGYVRKRSPLPWIGVGVLAVAAIVYLAVFRGGSAPAPKELTTRPLTSLVGVEDPGSWSPDGSFFAYSHSAVGPMDIFIGSAAGGEPMRLVQSPGDDGLARWSPDNRWIAFVSSRDRKTAIYLVPPLGGEPRLLAETNMPPLSDYTAGALGSRPWSPDGKTLLFTRLDENQKLTVWSVDLESGSQRQVTHPGPNEFDTVASYSRKGDKIMFCRLTPGGCDLMLVGLDGSGLRALCSETGRYVVPDWGPGDRTIVYGLQDGGLKQVDVGSGKVTRLTTGDAESSPVVSNDGRILYATSGHQTDLYEQSLATGEARRLTQHTRDNFGPRVSPDGRRIVYMSSRTGNQEIWLLDLESGAERQLTQRESDDWGPDWMRDGKEIVFVSNQGDGLGLWITSTEGGAARLLVHVPFMAAWQAKVSPEGSLIGFVAPGEDGNPSLQVVGRDGGEPRVILEGVSDFDWYLDDQRVVYTPSAGEQSGEIRVRHLGSGEEAMLANATHNELQVAADGTALSFVSSTSHFDMNLFVVHLQVPDGPAALPRAEGAPEKITHGEGEWHVHNGSWSPDGLRVLYTRDTDTGDLYVLDGAF